jgi:hypothetical protein
VDVDAGSPLHGAIISSKRRTCGFAHDSNSATLGRRHWTSNSLSSRPEAKSSRDNPPSLPFGVRMLSFTVD